MSTRTRLTRIAIFATLIAGSAFGQSPNCLFTITPQTNRALPTGGSGIAQVATSDQSCLWIGPATTNPALITLLGGGTFVGNGSISYSVAANTSNIPRSMSLQFTAMGTTVNSSFVRPTADYAIQIIQGAATPTQLFQDVAPADGTFDYVNLFKMYGITSGCSAVPALYCPDATTTRGQVSTFLVRAIVGENFSYTLAPYYTDVPPSHPQFQYIQKLTDLGVAIPCGNNLFCPENQMTRRDTAEFLIRGKFRGSIFAPDTLHNSTVPYFADMPATDPGFVYVQKMKDLGITSGCSATAYCPDSIVTRGQIAVFIIRLFFTSLLSYS